VDAGRDPGSFLVTVYSEFHERWFDVESPARAELAGSGVDRLILYLGPPFDVTRIERAGDSSANHPVSAAPDAGDRTLTGMTGEEHHDVVIVGGGAAGLNCALECFDIQLDTVLVEASATLGGQVSEILHSVRNVAAGRFADGRALQQALLESAEILGDRVRLSHPVTRRMWTRVRSKVTPCDCPPCVGRRYRYEEAELEAAPTAHSAVTSRTSSNRSLPRFAGRDVAVIGGVTARPWTPSSWRAEDRPSS